MLIEQKKTSYFSLIEKDFNKIDAINTFLATLELMKKQQISAHQEEKFKDIEITVKEGVETPLVNSEEKLDGQY